MKKLIFVIFIINTFVIFYVLFSEKFHNIKNSEQYIIHNTISNFIESNDTNIKNSEQYITHNTISNFIESNDTIEYGTNRNESQLELRKKIREYKTRYRQRFRRSIDCNQCSELELLTILEKAIQTGKAYPEEYIKIKSRIAKNEKAEFASILNTEYKKIFGMPITYFEFSMIGVYFSSGALLGGTSTSFLAIRTSTGAIIKYNNIYRNNTDSLEGTLDVKEWLNFANALHKCRINEWEKEYNLNVLDGTIWNFRVFFLDKDKLEFSGHNAYPPNWGELNKIINDIRTKISIDNI